MRFISFLSFQGLLSRTVANYVAGVRAWALYLGYPETHIFTFRVKNTLKHRPSRCTSASERPAAAAVVAAPDLKEWME
jgi:hypothetical protein